MRVASNLTPHFLLLFSEIFLPPMPRGGTPLLPPSLCRCCARVGTASSLTTDEDRKQSHALAWVASNLTPDAGRKQPRIPSYFVVCILSCGPQAASHPMWVASDLTPVLYAWIGDTKCAMRSVGSREHSWKVW